jgi:hypothetical protein
MEAAYLKAIRALTTDGWFRAQFAADPGAALSRRGLDLGEEQIAALKDIAGSDNHDDGVPAGSAGRQKGGGGWFVYDDFTPAALRT